MVRLLLERAGDHQLSGWSLLLGIGLFVSVSTLVALCANHARRNVPGKKENVPDKVKSKHVAPKSPLASPRKVVTSISNKAILFMSPKRQNRGDNKEVEFEEGFRGSEKGGLWQKSILMGERCRPPEFSGAIYYDSHGNQLSEMPRSPRAIIRGSPESFPLPVIINAN